MTEPIKLTIDGVEVEAKPGQTVLQAAIDSNVYIPYLCYWPGLKPYGACRMCCVEVEGGRGTPASCTLPVANGMVVNSLGTEIRGLRESVLELLLSEHPHGCLTCHRIELCGPQDICLRHVRVMDRCVVCPKNERCELKDTVRYVNVNMESPLSYNYRNLQIETGDPFYDRDYNLCIVCARCVRVCEEMRGDDAIAMIERSGTVLVGTSQGVSLLESGCEFCGACIDVCPVGALVERDHKWDKAVETVKTTCTHCSVGCQVNLEVDKRGRVIRSIGDWESPVNTGQLCYMGKFGNEFVNSRNRLKTPMLRQHGELVEATWEQAMEAIASRLPDYRGSAFSLLLSPRATNQQAYLAGRFAREVMGTNNVDLSVDHRPELVEPLGRRLGAMAATGTLADLENAGCVLVVNSNTTEEHNVAAIPIKKAHKAGGKLIVVDTREVELSRYADLWLRPYPGTEQALDWRHAEGHPGRGAAGRRVHRRALQRHGRAAGVTRRLHVSTTWRTRRAYPPTRSRLRRGPSRRRAAPASCTRSTTSRRPSAHPSRTRSSTSPSRRATLGSPPAASSRCGPAPQARAPSTWDARPRPRRRARRGRRAERCAVA